MALSAAQAKAQKAAKAAATAAAAANKKPEDASAAAPATSVPKAGLPTAGPLGPKIRAPAAPEVHQNKVAGGGRKVIVVCKSPRGLYLQHTQMIDQQFNLSNGAKEMRKLPMRVGEQIRLKPSVLAFGMIPNYTIRNGFSFTEVDANFWNTWYEQNKNFTMFESGLLCAFDNESDARAYCDEYGTLKHGLEPLSQSKDPRVEQPTSQNLTALDIDTDVPAAKG